VSAVETLVVPVPGARLHVERRGSGPALLLIAGGGGDAGYYEPLGERLADAYTVLSYDRRGNSRSALTEPPTALAIAQEADDALAVAEAAGAHRPLAFGNSGGAIVALELAARGSAAVAAVVAHEPPLVELLPDAAEQRRFYAEVLELFAQHGAQVAFKRFADGVGRVEDPVRDPALLARLAGNWDRFLRWELEGFVGHRPDLDRLQGSGVPLALAGGACSRGRRYYRPAVELARLLGAPFATFPGHHNAYLDEPDAFAAALREQLARLRGQAGGAVSP